MGPRNRETAQPRNHYHALVKTRLDNAKKAAADIHRATRMLARARRRLAKATKDDAPHVIVDPKYRSAHEALQEKAKSLSKIPGVVGYGVGHVVRKGMPTEQLCITVFVEEKLSAEELRKLKVKPIPRTVTVRGKRFRVDVVPIGTIRLQVISGASLGTDAPAPVTAGTIGAFAVDNVTKQNVAITAMHVSGITEYPNGMPPVKFVIPSRMQSGVNEPLGEIAFGTITGIDAAKIKLDDPADADNVLPGIGAIAGWRPVTIPGDNNAAVKMFGAMTNRVSRGVIIHPNVALPAFGLDAAILVDIPTLNGDSGAALVDANNHVLGFLVGEATGFDANFPSLRVFTPASAVLNVLDCDIPSTD